MHIPQIPRFMVRYHNKNTDNIKVFDEMIIWLGDHVSFWSSDIVIVSESGTTLGDMNYDCLYQIIYMNDPQVRFMFKLMFSDHLLEYKNHKKYIHPLSNARPRGQDMKVHIQHRPS